MSLILSPVIDVSSSITSFVLYIITRNSYLQINIQNQLTSDSNKQGRSQEFDLKGINFNESLQFQNICQIANAPVHDNHGITL